jgi:hypothetical protein
VASGQLKSMMLCEYSLKSSDPGSSSGALGLTVKHGKLGLAGGTAFPGCAELTCYFGTGWKACATDLTSF